VCSQQLQLQLPSKNLDSQDKTALCDTEHAISKKINASCKSTQKACIYHLSMQPTVMYQKTDTTADACAPTATTPGYCTSMLGLPSSGKFNPVAHVTVKQDTLVFSLDLRQATRHQNPHTRCYGARDLQAVPGRVPSHSNSGKEATG
jgi:hypothetical protein